MKIINLTPHDINVVAEGTSIVLETIPVSGVVARVGMEEEDLGRNGNIRFVRVRPGRPVNVPEPRPGTRFIVSRAVQEARPYCTDPYSEVPGQAHHYRVRRVLRELGCL